QLCHAAGMRRFLIDLRDGKRNEARQALMEPRLERFIGVIYRPTTERWSHYASAILPRQFDAWVWFDRTSALSPLATPQRQGAEETYPFGL
ncbi:MAG: erythromycin esterase family protein, partial [Sphingomonadaceae bacterium]